MEFWRVFVQSILGCTIEDCTEKFSALAQQERAAWEAVAAFAVPVECVGSAVQGVQEAVVAESAPEVQEGQEF